MIYYWNFCIKGWTQITLHAKERTLYYTKVLSNLYKAVYCLILIRKFRLLLDLWPIIIKSLHKRAIEKNNNNRPDDNDNDNDDYDVDCFPLQDRQTVLPQDILPTTSNVNTTSLSLIEPSPRTPPQLSLNCMTTAERPLDGLVLLFRVKFI